MSGAAAAGLWWPGPGLVAADAAFVATVDRRWRGGERWRFFSRFADLAYPLLDPGNGMCGLYAVRPLSCRTYGLPTRLGDVTLPACRRNLVGVSAATRRAAEFNPDPDDREGALLRRLAEFEVAGDTIVAAVIAGPASTGRALRRGRLRTDGT